MQTAVQVLLVLLPVCQYSHHFILIWSGFRVMEWPIPANLERHQGSYCWVSYIKTILDMLRNVSLCYVSGEVLLFTLLFQLSLTHSHSINLAICCQALHAKALHTNASHAFLHVYTVVFYVSISWTACSLAHAHFKYLRIAVTWLLGC